MEEKTLTKTPFRADVILDDYRLVYRSRQASIIGRREVLTGKAKFGIFGDGKELAQVAIAHAFKKGDWRSGYYRDQTWMMALGLMDVQQFFAELYAHADNQIEPNSGGRNMNNHFSSPMFNEKGEWLDQTERYNTAADIPPTGSQMPRTVGLAYSSVLFRKLESLKELSKFSINGNEVTWATIGNASTSEGLFWESVNAIGVMHAPAVITVYDDGYGISVPNEFQMVKENIYSILKGFERTPCPAEECGRGYDLYSVSAWNYPELIATYKKAGEIARKYHIPALIHVTEATQPLGHSTSGSHERYKSTERLEWEEEFDCMRQFRLWMIENKIATHEQLDTLEKEEKTAVEAARKNAWEAFQAPIKTLRKDVSAALKELAGQSAYKKEITQMESGLISIPDPLFRDIASTLHDIEVLTRNEAIPARKKISSLALDLKDKRYQYYQSYQFSGLEKSPLQVEVVPAKYSDTSPWVMGFEVINAAFDEALKREPRLIAFGEDVGKLGDVNQGFRGLQDKYGPFRVSDTGIREATIIGQAIGMALRGLRPIAEIQYLDYLLYGLQIMADDLANLYWRSAGRQKAPVIIRTRGHRLEGIFHSGSPMAGIINLVRGMHVLVPRNLTQAAGFYNTLLLSEDPALVIEVLNGYRHKERLPENIGEFTVPLGVPEILREGDDLTLVTYGAMVRIAMEAAEKLANVGISVEVIDVQSLLPFDIRGMIVNSLKKTSRILFTDEDVPGGTTAYMMQQVLEVQNGYEWLDSAPRTLPGANHRPAYGSDGDYYSKPNVNSVFDAVYEIMHESNPKKFPKIR